MSAPPPFNPCDVSHSGNLEQSSLDKCLRDGPSDVADRHLKCDAHDTICSNCLRQDLDCIRHFNVRFKHVVWDKDAKPKPRKGISAVTSRRNRYNFARGQTWVPTAANLTFIDASKDIAVFENSTSRTTNVNERTGRDVASVFHGSLITEPTFSTPFSNHNSQTCLQASQSSLPLLPSTGLGVETGETSHTQYTASHTSTEALQFSPAHNGGSQTDQENAPRSSHEGPHDLESTAKTTTEAHVATVFSSTEGQGGLLNAGVAAVSTQTISEDTPSTGFLSPSYTALRTTLQWPICDQQEAQLFWYFIENVATLFDLCDNDRHFARVAPQRAASCRPLFNSMLAASAKRLSRISGFDSMVVDHYYQACLKALIPALSSSAAVVDENLLTAIVILRYFEELDVPISHPAPESHLVGTRVFLGAATAAAQGSAMSTSCELTGLRLAAYWLALRQEIYMSLIHARPVHPNFVLKVFGEPDDSGCEYANRIIVHTARCLRYCYGPQDEILDTWEELDTYRQHWWDSRPWYYQPLWKGPTHNELFPNEMYLNDAVVTGLQHYYMTRILMLAHDPKFPRLGPGHVAAARAIAQEVKTIACIICGIAESNPRTAPAYVNACIAITMVGDRFTDRREQEALYAILVKTDRELAWPTTSAQRELRKTWGWV